MKIRVRVRSVLQVFTVEGLVQTPPSLLQLLHKVATEKTMFPLNYLLASEKEFYDITKSGGVTPMDRLQCAVLLIHLVFTRVIIQQLVCVPWENGIGPPRQCGSAVRRNLRVLGAVLWCGVSHACMQLRQQQQQSMDLAKGWQEEGEIINHVELSTYMQLDENMQQQLSPEVDQLYEAEIFQYVSEPPLIQQVANQILQWSTGVVHKVWGQDSPRSKA